MKINLLATLVVGSLCAPGCAAKTHSPRAPSPVIRLLTPVRNQNAQRNEQIFQFAFGGLYAIDSAERAGIAQQLALVPREDPARFADGAIEAEVRPVPYGVQLRLRNRLPDLLILDGTRCALIDIFGRSHAVELRYPTAVYPPLEPISQTMPIPPQSMLHIDLDVISPAHRSTINEVSRTPQERGAFIATEAPLPVFCSGYFLYPSRRDAMEQAQKWAIGRVFGLYFELAGEQGRYCYQFQLRPLRYSTGPRESPFWSSTQPTPIAGQEPKRQGK
jgi:hypothetical protein